jgi:5'-phosphate synthase pdxT subunit
MSRIGVLAFQGDVGEHIAATEGAARKLKKRVSAVPVRTREELGSVSALIIPGGESTTLQMLCEREGMFEDMKNVRYIFGTCAGAILMAKQIKHEAEGQTTLMLMDIEIHRNAYGRQNESFEASIKTTLGPMHAVFIRAPRITRIGKGVNVLAKDGSEVLACEQKTKNGYLLVTSFHPELTTTLFHEYFLKSVVS